MLENDMCITVIDQAVLELLSFNPIPPGGGGAKSPPTKIFNNSWTSAGIKPIIRDFS